MKEKSPAFQFYPKDFLTDMKVICMSHELRGMYITLLCIDWLEDGFPKDRMLSLCGGIAMGEDQHEVGINKVKFIVDSLAECFICHPSKKGFLTNKRLLKEREKQGLYRQKQKENADMRWHKPGNAVGLPNACSSSSSSSSTPVKRESFAPPTQLLIIEYFKEIGSNIQEADKFKNFYESKGWMVGKNKMKDWKAAARNWVSRDKKPGVQPAPAKALVFKKDPECPCCHGSGYVPNVPNVKCQWCWK